jgi:hypothetical protein
VENYHVSNQSRNGGTRKLEKRSFNGISVRPASAQKEAARGKNELRRSQENNSASSGSYWDEYSETSYSSKEIYRELKHRRRKTSRAREENRARSISAPPSDDEEYFVQETPEAAFMAAQAYLLATQLEPGDPWEHRHQAAIKSLGLVGDKLKQHSSEKKPTYYEHKENKRRKYQSPQSQKSDSTSDEDHEARTTDARNIIAQSRVNKARYAWNEENYEDDKKEMGALCFTRRVDNEGTQRIQITTRLVEI